MKSLARLGDKLLSTGFSDTGFSDTGLSDTGLSDTGPSDTGPSDTGLSDTGLSNTMPGTVHPANDKNVIRGPDRPTTRTLEPRKVGGRPRKSVAVSMAWRLPRG